MKTTRYRKRIWSTLDHYGGNCKYYRNKENMAERKQMLMNNIKPNIKEEYCDKVIKALNNNEFPDFYFDKYDDIPALHHWIILYRTEIKREEKDSVMDAWDKKKIITWIRQNETDIKRLEN
jgi:hypothetical protein